IERKAETVLALKKSNEDGREIVTVHATPPAGKTRNAPIPEYRGPRFAWDSEAGMHLSIQMKVEARKSAKEQELFDLAGAVWREDPDTTLPFNKVVERLIRHSEREGLGRNGKGFSERTAAQRILQMTNCSAAEKSLVPGHYNLTATAKQRLQEKTA